MYFLNLSGMLPTALLGMLFTLLACAILLLVLRLCGFRLLWRKKARSKREKLKAPAPVAESHTENELSEEELVVILTAAAMTALGEGAASRFRVVAFRRL